MIKKERSKSLSYYDEANEDNDDVYRTESPLCLCEYYNRNNERSHILMCCCNCEAFDTLCTWLVCCGCCDKQQRLRAYLQRHTSARHLLSETLADMSDRLRIPFPGGARQLDGDFIVALVALLVYVCVGKLNFVCSLLTIVIVPTLLYARFFLARISFDKHRLASHQDEHINNDDDGNNNNALLTGVTSSSSIKLKDMSKSMNRNRRREVKRIRLAHYLILNGLGFSLIIFNWSLHTELAKSQGEWLLFNCLITIALVLHIFIHMSNPGFVDLAMWKSSQQQVNEPSKSFAKTFSFTDLNYCSKCHIKRGNEFNIGHCPVCKCCSFNRDHHCFWIDNCIGYLNHKSFLVYLIYLLFFFTFSFIRILVVLWSLDCKLTRFKQHDTERSCLFDVYYADTSHALMILLLFQLISLITYLVMLLFQQCLFISVNVTQQQLFRLSQANPRFSLAVYLANHLSFKSLLRNWMLFLRRRSQTTILDRQRHLLETFV